MLPYLFAISLILLAVALAGIISDRHFVVLMLAVELILISSSIMLISFFSYTQAPDPSAVPMLISIWSVAAVEIMALVTFYIYMKSKGYDFDVTKLSKLKW